LRVGSDIQSGLAVASSDQVQSVDRRVEPIEFLAGRGIAAANGLVLGSANEAAVAKKGEPKNGTGVARLLEQRFAFGEVPNVQRRPSAANGELFAVWRKDQRCEMRSRSSRGE